ncbi:hypothetical protein PIB30_044873 [Stylosanthes scabra]|uniref:Uncharacterized protein n=1 Tax=Stylosanthes scabra TaxID=79078 RepID=A0ABU6QGI2_9FABA|nr:hypothetical protein [Stylosanthes scabra]
MGLWGADSHNQPPGDEDGDVPPSVANDSLHCVIRTLAGSLGRFTLWGQWISSFRACWSCGAVALSCPPDTIVPCIEEADFEGLLRMRDFDIDGPLLSSFVEQ